MKADWGIKAFDACIEKRKAPTKLLSSSYQEKGLYPIVSQEKDLISGYWDNPDDLFVHRKPVVVFGDHTMVVKYIDFDFVVGADGVKILEPKEFLLPKYFFYWVSSVHIKSRGYARHYRYLREASVPIPSLPEQQHIVDILDREFAKIDALKANAEKSLQAAKDLFQATLNKELEPKEGWKTEKIGEVFEITDFVSNGSFASLRENVKYHDEPNYAVLVRLVDNSNGFDPNKFVYLDEHGYNFLAKSKLFGGELIMCNIGATIGTTFICPDLGMPMSIGPNSLLIRTPDNVFFNYYLQSQSFKKKLKGIIAKTTLEKFNKTQFKELVISFPEGQERKGIVSRLENLCAKSKTLQDNYQKTLALCDDLKQALLRKAFNGEL